VTLTLTDAWGDAGVTTRVVSFTAPPTNAAPNVVIDAPVCTARTCTLSATTSTDPDGDAFTYLWDFGDGSTSTVATPSHLYLADNTYTVTLTLTDTWGAANSTTRQVTIAEPASNVPPNPVINPVTCVVRTCTIYGVSSSDPNGDSFTYLWSFGSGTTTSAVSTPSFTYPADGTYTITLTVTDWWGDAATATRQVVIGEPANNAAPNPVINAPSCVERTCSFSSAGTIDPNGDSITYVWNWGDGTPTSTTANASHTFPAVGTYTVTLTATDGWGDANSVTRQVSIVEPPGNVAPNPVINAPSCVGLVCTFSSAGSTDPNGDTFTYLWNWGDGTANATTANPSHTFPAANTYTVTLTLTDAWGRANSVTRQVTV
jgi:PKD repeat protein